MTSAKKAQANRQNALKSTGPKTPEGKANVRQNALKHGLLAQEVLLSEDDEEALRELDDSLGKLESHWPAHRAPLRSGKADTDARCDRFERAKKSIKT